MRSPRLISSGPTAATFACAPALRACKTCKSVAVQIAASLSMDRLVSIAEQAGKAIMEIYQGDADKWEVDHKADDSPLTRADKEANKIICDALAAWTPHIPIISEENAMVPYSTRQVQRSLQASSLLLQSPQATTPSEHNCVILALAVNRPSVVVMMCPVMQQ